MKNITGLIILIGAVAIGYYIYKKSKENKANTAVGVIGNFDSEAFSSIALDTGIVTANNVPLNNPVNPVVNQVNNQPVPVTQINPDYAVPQIQSLPANTVYATAQGYQYSANGITYEASGLGDYIINPDRPVQVTANPTLQQLGIGQTYVPVSGGGYAIVNQNEIPVEWYY